MDKENKILVKDKYQINLELLVQLAKDDKHAGFFKKSLKFYNDVNSREINTLSEKQLNWLNEIEGILHDRENNKEINETWGKEIQVKPPENLAPLNSEKTTASLWMRIINKIKEIF